jgi:mRNA interferase HicA
MKGSEFLRKLRALAHVRGVTIRLNAERGKGSHQTLYYGDKFTVLRNVKDELKTGTFRAMCKQLGVDPKDL